MRREEHSVEDGVSPRQFVGDAAKGATAALPATASAAAGGLDSDGRYELDNTTQRMDRPHHANQRGCETA